MTQPTVPGQPVPAQPPSQAVSAPRAVVAGVISAWVALGLGELLAGLLRPVASPVYAVGAAIVRLAPGWLERAAIGLLGTADKPALLIGIVAVASAFGGVVGLVALRRPALAVLAFSGFGVVGAAAAAAVPDESLPLTIVAIAAAILAGLATLRGLQRAATPRTDSGVNQSRREFLRLAAVCAVAAGGAAFAGRWLADRAALAAARLAVVIPRPLRPVTVPAGAELGISGLSPYVVPNADFYRIDTALSVPMVDPTNWQLAITGEVARPFQLTYEELVAMATDEQAITLSCVSNEIGGYLVGNAVWQGVPLRDLLGRAGVNPAGTQLVGRSVDGFTAGFPTEIAMTTEALVAVGMNGEPLPIDHGFPARLVVPGLYGYVSATKWLSEIHLTGFDTFDGYWVPRGWAKEGPIKTQSRIDVPRPGTTLPPGPARAAGVAWAPTRGIRSVQVRIDEQPWQPARLADVVGPDTWRQWVLDWQATPGQHQLQVRAVDGSGETQTDALAPPFPSGATGHHTVTVTVE